MNDLRLAKELEPGDSKIIEEILYVKVTICCTRIYYMKQMMMKCVYKHILIVA